MLNQNQKSNNVVCYFDPTNIYELMTSWILMIVHRGAIDFYKKSDFTSTLNIGEERDVIFINMSVLPEQIDLWLKGVKSLTLYCRIRSVKTLLTYIEEKKPKWPNLKIELFAYNVSMFSETWRKIFVSDKLPYLLKILENTEINQATKEEKNIVTTFKTMILLNSSTQKAFEIITTFMDLLPGCSQFKMMQSNGEVMNAHRSMLIKNISVSSIRRQMFCNHNVPIINIPEELAIDIVESLLSSEPFVVTYQDKEKTRKYQITSHFTKGIDLTEIAERFNVVGTKTYVEFEVPFNHALVRYYGNQD